MYECIVILYLPSRQRIVRSVNGLDRARPSGFYSLTAIDLKEVPYFWKLCHDTKLQNMTVSVSSFEPISEVRMVMCFDGYEFQNMRVTLS